MSLATQPVRPRADTGDMHTVLPEWNALALCHRGAVIDEMRRMHELSAEREAGVAGLAHDREENTRLLMAYAAALLGLEG